MNYICHNRFKKIGASGKEYLIRYKDTVETVGKYIAKGAEAICAITSDDAFRHFARNDDNNGLERGKLTIALQKQKLKCCERNTIGSLWMIE